MKCYKQPLFPIAEPIANVWEVVLAPGVWDDVVAVAGRQGVTYSWVVRACIFKLLANRNLLSNKKSIVIHSKKVKVRGLSRHTGHRHMLCLYGEDEKRLRMAALQQGLAVSVLLRIALSLYLGHLFNKKSLNKSGTIKVVRAAFFQQLWQRKFLVLEKLIYYHY